MSATDTTIAGIPVPDSQIAREATEFVQDIATPLLFDHSRRVFLWASLQGQKGDLFMQHWRQQVSPTVGNWEFAGNVCRGADDPVVQKPQITV